MTIERTRRISRKNQVIRPRQLWTMLKPYFWPYGWGPRAHVLATWTLVLAAKAVSILSPLYIGVATDILVRQNIVPWGDIATYTMLAVRSLFILLSIHLSLGYLYLYIEALFLATLCHYQLLCIIYIYILSLYIYVHHYRP